MPLTAVKRPDRPKPRIAVVDDDPIFGKLMEGFGRHHGFEVTYCDSLRAAKRLQSASFDVLVFDYDMGGVDGLALASATEQRISVPIILVSNSQDVLRIAPWPVSIVGFLAKAVGPRAILIAALQAHKDRDRVRPDVIPPALARAF